MIHEPRTNDAYRFEPPMRMPGKSRYRITVIHTPAIASREIAADLPASQALGDSLFSIADGVGVIVVHTEQKGVEGLPGKTKFESVLDEFWCHVSMGARGEQVGEPL